MNTQLSATHLNYRRCWRHSRRTRRCCRARRASRGTRPAGAASHTRRRRSRRRRPGRRSSRKRRPRSLPRRPRRATPHRTLPTLGCRHCGNCRNSASTPHRNNRRSTNKEKIMVLPWLCETFLSRVHLGYRWESICRAGDRVVPEKKSMNILGQTRQCALRVYLPGRERHPTLIVFSRHRRCC